MDTFIYVDPESMIPDTELSKFSTILSVAAFNTGIQCTDFVDDLIHVIYCRSRDSGK